MAKGSVRKKVRSGTTASTNLIQSGASPKDVQEMLGHSDIGTTMNWYAHGTKDTKRSSVKVLDQLTG